MRIKKGKKLKKGNHRALDQDLHAIVHGIVDIEAGHKQFIKDHDKYLGIVKDKSQRVLLAAANVRELLEKKEGIMPCPGKPRKPRKPK